MGLCKLFLVLDLEISSSDSIRPSQSILSTQNWRGCSGSHQARVLHITFHLRTFIGSAGDWILDFQTCAVVPQIEVSLLWISLRFKWAISLFRSVLPIQTASIFFQYLIRLLFCTLPGDAGKWSWDLPRGKYVHTTSPQVPLYNPETEIIHGCKVIDSLRTCMHLPYPSGYKQFWEAYKNIIKSTKNIMQESLSHHFKAKDKSSNKQQ